MKETKVLQNKKGECILSLHGDVNEEEMVIKGMDDVNDVLFYNE